MKKLMFLPALVLLFGIALYPWLTGVYQSFTNFHLLRPHYHFIGLGNYVRFLSSTEGLQMIKVTFLYTILVLVIELPLGVGVALLLNKKIFGINILRTLLVIPLVMPPVVSGLMWKMMMRPGSGVFNYLFGLVGLPPFAWLTGKNTSLLSIALIDAWVYTPFVVLIILAGLQSIPTELKDAAAVDGASKTKTFLYVILPLVTPHLIIATIFRSIDSMRMFDLIYSTTRGGPGAKTMNIHMGSYLFGIKHLNMSYALASLTILYIFIYLLIFSFFSLLGRSQRRL